MANSTDKNRPWGGLGLALVYLTIFTGSTYAILQAYLKVSQGDALFVGLIMANTFAIYRLSVFLKRTLQLSSLAYERSLVTTKVAFSAEVFIGEIFAKKKAFLTGLVFGAIFLLMAVLISPWQALNQLNYFLALFLFVANILTGMALYSLANYFKYSLLIGANIDVDLWDRSDPAVSALIDTNQYIVLAVAFTSCVAIISVLGSKFDLDHTIFIFTLFSISVVLLTYFLPLMPITKKLWAKKKLVIEEIGAEMQQEYNRLTCLAKNETADLDTSRLDALTTMLKTVKAVKALPPVGEHSINTAILATIITMIPSAIDFIAKLDSFDM